MNWSQDKIAAFRQTLLAWYDAEKRDLPWRRDQEPYHILISETMLQQTQVATVIPYYERFLTQFPTVEALAAASEAAVLKAWEGLGYYSRARNLQKAAKQLVADHGGRWPETAAELRTLSGIGPYTAGAIASIAFNQVEPAIDGNAFRVFARLFCVPDDIAQPKSRAVFDTLIRQVIDPKRPGDFNQAIMDLGSSYMSAKDADPAHSPVAAFDESYQTGRVYDFPVKTKKPRPKKVPYFALVLHSPAGYLMVQRPSTGMLANLWMFPLVAREELEGTTLPAQLAEAAAQFGASAGVTPQLAVSDYPLVRHTFTHQQWQLTLVTAETAAFDLAFLPGRWVPAAEFDQLALPTVQKKLLAACQGGAS
ncbi:A/G-specific adenine glycosylase [Lacticaseibacillus daqingensis]|uniref:A/G-specific adenine glycosylase n=1 Tax=Lacticaseibacillus daqingensis TaxID=2486014 RepID=UPI000F78727B|nr:A/G-specific adenine glycosylase [Lacticaseibacillus daqingensis]